MKSKSFAAGWPHGRGLAVDHGRSVRRRCAGDDLGGVFQGVRGTGPGVRKATGNHLITVRGPSMGIRRSRFRRALHVARRPMW